MDLSELTHSVCHQDTYQKLHKEYSRSIRNFIYYKSGNLEHAEDIVQEAFVKLWENCKKVAVDKAKSFLYTVSQRLFLNSVRHEKVQLNFIKESVSKDNHEDPSYIMREKEFKDYLEKAISELSEKQREVFLMNRIDKMSYEEIATSLDISVKAVEKRMHNALFTLKEKVKELNTYKI
jgi:RNA polymerase sigma-70 factor (ECF subfamily)